MSKHLAPVLVLCLLAGAVSAQVSPSADDYNAIFKTLKWRGESNFAGQQTIASGNFESRQFKINLTYRFGSNTVKAARQRKDASEEEKRRTEGGGGIGVGSN